MSDVEDTPTEPDPDLEALADVLDGPDEPDIPGPDVDLSEVEKLEPLPDPDAEGVIPIIPAERYVAGENLDPEPATEDVPDDDAE